MNTKVKVAIAGAIVAALVALIVLDQQTAPSTAGPEPIPGATPDGNVVLTPAASPDDHATILRANDVRHLMEEAGRAFNGGAPAPAQPQPPARVVEPQPSLVEPARTTAVGAEYLVREGDTLETIAQAHYGSRTWLSLITQANPGLRPERLRIGQKLVLPPKPEKVEKQVDEPALVKAPAPEPAVAVDGGSRTYVVQPGDTLTGISSKVYKTIRHYDKIYEANRDRISDPNLLVVGTKLVMPDLPVRNAAASGGAVAVSAAVGKTHVVAQGESLWKIAERYAQQRGLGVLDMIQEFVKANPDKLRDDKTLLRLGWQLVVPE